MLSERKFFAGAFAAAMLVSAPLTALAFTIDSSTNTGKTFDVSWELMGASNPIGMDLTGNASFEYLGLEAGDTQMRFGLTLENTTVSNTSGGFSNVALSAFGFGTDPNFSLASWGSAGGAGSGPSDNGRIVSVSPVDPSAGPGTAGAGSPDFNNPGTSGSPVACKDDPNNIDTTECITVLAVAVDDPNNPGLPSGDSDVFEFVLDLGQVVSPTTQVTFNPFAVAYGYDDPTSSTRQEIQIAANQVPVPGTLLLLGVGALLVGRKRASN